MIALTRHDDSTYYYDGLQRRNNLHPSVCFSFYKPRSENTPNDSGFSNQQSFSLAQSFNLAIWTPLQAVVPASA